MPDRKTAVNYQCTTNMRQCWTALALRLRSNSARPSLLSTRSLQLDDCSFRELYPHSEIAKPFVSYGTFMRWICHDACSSSMSEVLVPLVRTGTTEDDCLEVLRRSAAPHVSERADSEIDTIIGDGGVKASAGEMQRLCVSPVLLR